MTNIIRSFFLLTRHHLMHFCISLFVYYFLNSVKPLDLSMWIIGVFLPDFDHFATLFISQDVRSRSVRKALLQKGSLSKRLENSVKNYWKSDQGFDQLWLHNFGSMAVTLILFILLLPINMPLASLCGSMVVHMLTDVMGDLARWGHFDHWTNLPSLSLN